MENRALFETELLHVENKIAAYRKEYKELDEPLAHSIEHATLAAKYYHVQRVKLEKQNEIIKENAEKILQLEQKYYMLEFYLPKCLFN